MLNLKSVISIIENANGVRLLEEKARPIYEQMIYCKKEKGQIISHAGDKSSNLFILLSGIIRLYYIDMDGNDVTRFFGTKGCISTGADERLPFVAEALEACEFMLLDWATAKSLMGGDIYWLTIWNRLLQNSIRYKVYRESSFLTESATERYISFRRMYSGLENQVNHSHIASYLGITPVSLSRIRRTIKEER